MSSIKNRHIYLQGTVCKKTMGNYHVHVDGRLLLCTISTKLRKTLVYPTAAPTSLRRVVRQVNEIDCVDPVAVGDQVYLIDAKDGTGMIIEVLERKSALIRPEASGPFERHARQQVIVANLDQMVAVLAAAQPPPKWTLLDRYLVSAESLGLKSIVCITKIDLVEDRKNLEDVIWLYRQIGYPVVLTSVVCEEGLEQLKESLTNRLSVLVGKSGVGKTSLLNTIQPGLGRKINEVSGSTGKGKHTTSNLEMLPLVGGGNVVDTPGMREFGLWEVDNSNLAWCFPEMRTYIGKCRFKLDCIHQHEPGCAVHLAVKQGAVSQQRYESYVRLLQG
jgi:ribosome biogenesis GTPase